VDKVFDKLTELVSGGFFFEHPRLIPIAILVLTGIYLWRFQGARGFGPWRSVLAASTAVLLVLSIIGWLAYRYWGLPDSFADGQIGILIAEVPGDQQGRQHQEAYQNAIRLRVQNSDELREIVKVRLIERPLPPDAEARQAEAVKIGRWLRAAFVVRPFVVEGTQEPWLTVVNPQNMFQPESSLGKFSTPQLAELDTLPLPEDLAQLAETALALALSERHSYKEAARVLGDVLRSGHLPEAATSRWALHRLRGDALLVSGINTEAVTEYQEALRLKPDFAEAHSNLGAALYAEGLNDAAIAEVKQALRLKPDFAEAHNGLGLILNAVGYHDAAIAEVKQALRLKPDFAEAHNNLGAALYVEGRQDAAIAEYREALRLKPDFAAARDGLGLALNAAGQHGAAIAELKEALRLKPDYSDAHCNLGGCA
jgi:Flp pilus assembly protein TadD